MSDGEQDKKRNKLGYQRIPIACAHCRRRKIRCLLADKDPQGRCQNCIRLKKECLFYPIEQKNAQDSRSDHNGHHGFGSASSSAMSSTSPDIQTSHGHGVGRSQFPPFPQRAQTFQSMSMEPGMAYQGHYFPPERAYSESLSSNSPWPSSTVPGGFGMRPPPRTVSPGRPNDSQSWAYDQSPGSGDFAPFPNEFAQRVRTPSTTFNAAFPQSSPEQQWQLQQPTSSVRSMTYPLPAASMASSLPQYAHSYAIEAPQPMPPGSYSPFSAPLESPEVMRQMQGSSFSTPIPQSQTFPEHGGAYDRPHVHGAMPVQQGYPLNWYAESSGLGVSVDQQSSIPSNAPSSYVVPSQRPR